MYSEIEAIEKLKNKLIGFGYDKSTFRTNVSTPYGKMIDLVIYEFNKPKIVFEVKSNVRLPSFTNTDEFRFHPTVRQAQSLSQEVNAPNFAIFDGDQILWFDVDEEDGRPRLLPNPIMPSTNFLDATTSEDQSNRLLKIFFELNDIEGGHSDYIEVPNHVAMAILARLFSEAGNNELEKLLQTANAKPSSFDEGFEGFEISRNEFHKNFYPKAFRILDQLDLSPIPANEFLDALDSFIQFNSERFRIFYPLLPFWITELMASLLPIDPSNVVLDAYSIFGDGAVAVNELNEQTRILSIAPYDRSLIWNKLKRAVLGLSQQDVILYQRSAIFAEQDNPFSSKVNHILVTPPFGGRTKSEYRFSYSEDAYLVSALRWVEPGGTIVAIVPENILFSKSRTTIRQFILNRANVQAVISLEQFSPGTSIKASIIVLNKKYKDVSQNAIMMGKIMGKDINVDPSSRKSIGNNKKIHRLINAYISHQTNQQTDYYWFIAPDELNMESWSVSSYDPSIKGETTSEFPVFPLNELVDFRKGAHLTLDKKGTISVIGPAAVRELEVDISKLDKTTKDNIPQNAKPVRANDILVHALSTYRGQTAIVEQELENTFVSRNIIILRILASNIIPAYLAVALNSRFVRRQLEDRATGSVITQLTIRKLQDVLIPLPDMELQKAIVRKVYTARQKITEIEHQVLVVQSALKEQQESLQSILDNIHMGGGKDD